MSLGSKVDKISPPRKSKAYIFTAASTRLRGPGVKPGVETQERRELNTRGVTAQPGLHLISLAFGLAEPDGA